MLIADSLLQQQKPALPTSIIADPDILSHEKFLPTTIYPTDLCATSLHPHIPWNPSFDFVPPLPHKITPALATQNLPSILLTAAPPSYAVSTVSVNSLSNM